jgi:hypothetical protein
MRLYCTSAKRNCWGGNNLPLSGKRLFAAGIPTCFSLDTLPAICYQYRALTAWFLRAAAAPSPSGKAEVCKTSITSSNLVGASNHLQSQPAAAGFSFICR